MADKSTQLVLDALSKAVADPAGLPLHGSKASSGLFAVTSTAKQAAEQCKGEGYLHVVRTKNRGKTMQEISPLPRRAWLTCLPRSVRAKCSRTWFMPCNRGRAR